MRPARIVWQVVAATSRALGKSKALVVFEIKGGNMSELDNGITYFNSQPNRKKCPECGVAVEVIKKNGEGVLICRHDVTCKHAHLNDPES